MIRTNIAKTVAAGALAAVMAVSMTGCSSGSAEISATYMLSNASYLDAIAWYSNDDIMLVTNSDNTYDLYYKNDIFGTTDPGVKGNKTIIYSGTYTSEASADGDANHMDVTLSAPTRIYFEQHGKAYGRNGYASNMMLDTANWTDAMTTLAFPAGSEDGSADFLAKYGKEITMTVEDPSKAPDDTTLSYRIVEMSVETLDITGNE